MKYGPDLSRIAELLNRILALGLRRAGADA
jgi:hypothetical protein